MRTNSKARPWVVICSRQGSIPQAIGAFMTRQGAVGWISKHREKYPLWAFSTASLTATPKTPVPWDNKVPQLAPLPLWRRWFGRRRRAEREQGE